MQVSYLTFQNSPVNLASVGILSKTTTGIEILKIIKVEAPQAKCRYWRDHTGPEIDYVVEHYQKWLPIEVKLTSRPSKDDARHLHRFMKEHSFARKAYIICQTPRAVEIAPNILAVGWQELDSVIKEFLNN